MSDRDLFDAVARKTAAATPAYPQPCQLPVAMPVAVRRAASAPTSRTTAATGRRSRCARRSGSARATASPSGPR